jgi:hypothetical protein
MQAQLRRAARTLHRQDCLCHDGLGDAANHPMKFTMWCAAANAEIVGELCPAL